MVLIAIGAFFLIANRGAYQSYFADDEFENISLTRRVGPSEAPLALVWPRYYTNNFRPTGHLYFRALAATAGLNYRPYVAALHFFHLLNLVMLWIILRRLALPFDATMTGVLFFAFHMAVFDVYWRPAYVYDLLSGTFCLAAILCWIEDRWILSLLAFWLAYRSKEIAVLLPAALACYEWLLGKRRWKLLIPFVALSLWLGIQGLWAMLHAPGAYSLHAGLADLVKSLTFYASSVFLAPRGGLVLVAGLLAIVALLNDRRAWFGVILAALLLTPMLPLSERLSGAYLYVPLIGLAITIAAIASRPRAAAIVAICFALWIPWNYVNLRRLRRATLGEADDRRQYIATLTTLIREHPDLGSFIYQDGPLLFWGVSPAIHWLRPYGSYRIVTERADLSVLQEPVLAVLHWDRTTRQLQPVLRTPGTPDVAYIRMSSRMPLWQLGPGWLPGESAPHRWTRPFATARLHRPEGASEFELIVNIGPEYIGSVKRSHVEVRLNGQRIGSAEFDRLGFQTVRWKLDPEPSGKVEVSFDTSPVYLPGPLGSAIVAFGFPSGRSPEP